MQYPYIVVAVMPTSGGSASYDDIEKALGEEFHSSVKKGEGAFQDVVKNAAANTPVLDRARNRFVIRSEMDVADVGKVKGLSVGFLGAKNITIMVQWYARADDFDGHLATFQSLLDSCKFETGYAFTPGGSSPAERFARDARSTSTGVGILIVALGAVGVIIARRFRRAKQAASESI